MRNDLYGKREHSLTGLKNRAQADGIWRTMRELIIRSVPEGKLPENQQLY